MYNECNSDFQKYHLRKCRIITFWGEKRTFARLFPAVQRQLVSSLPFCPRCSVGRDDISAAGQKKKTQIGILDPDTSSL